MKLRDLTTPLFEAPIGDFDYVGNWGDKDRNSSFSDPKDRRLLTNPKAVEKIKQRFGKTEHVLNMYFVNLPEGGRNKEVGLVDRDWLVKNMPITYEYLTAKQQVDPEAINVIYTNNSGANRYMMSAWIIAHRLGHAIQATNRRFVGGNRAVFHNFKEVEVSFGKLMRETLRDAYGYKSPEGSRWGLGGGIFGIPDGLATGFIQTIGTTKAARDNNLGGRPYEYIYEMFAQYILTGNIRFNPLPDYFQYYMGRGDRRTLRKVKDYDGYDNPFGDYGEHDWGDRFDSTLWECHGKFLVM